MRIAIRRLVLAMIALPMSDAVRGYITREFARRGEDMRILAVQGLENAFPCQ